MNKKFILLFFLNTIYSLYGQSNDSKTIESLDNGYKYEWKDNRIGATLSMMTGYGLSYLRMINDNFAIKTQLFAYGSIEDDTFYENEIDLAVGLELQYNIMKARKSRLYLLGGAFYNYNKRIETNDLYFEYNDEYKSYITENSNHFGLGIGFELLAYNNISASIDGGYYGRFSNTTEEYEVDNTISEVDFKRKIFEFGLGAAFSIYYSF